MLVTHLLDIMSEWRLAFFPQDRTYCRAVRQCLAGLCTMGRRTISRALCCFGLDQRDWSAEYRIHSRCAWNSCELFEPIVRRAHPMCGERYVAIAYDAGHIHKTGRKIHWNQLLGRSAFTRHSGLTSCGATGIYRLRCLYPITEPGHTRHVGVARSVYRRPGCEEAW